MRSNSALVDLRRLDLISDEASALSVEAWGDAFGDGRARAPNSRLLSLRKPQKQRVTVSEQTLPALLSADLNHTKLLICRAKHSATSLLPGNPTMPQRILPFTRGYKHKYKRLLQRPYFYHTFTSTTKIHTFPLDQKAFIVRLSSHPSSTLQSCSYHSPTPMIKTHATSSSAL